ncbi:unnamed protein product, partial [Darwinula stevensoni]
ALQNCRMRPSRKSMHVNHPKSTMGIWMKRNLDYMRIKRIHVGGILDPYESPCRQVHRWYRLRYVVYATYSTKFTRWTGVMTVKLLSSLASKPVVLGAISFIFLHGVTSTDFVAHHAVHLGEKYENITLETKEAERRRNERRRNESVRICGIRCVLPTPPCYAFNYRESDGSCQLVSNETSGLVESDGFIAYVQRLCLTEHPTIQNAEVSFEHWSGKFPAPPGGKVILRCQHPTGFSDGSQLHTAECASASPDTWWSSFKEGTISCSYRGKTLYKYPECRLTEKGREYIGKVSETESGKECLRWDSKDFGTPNDSLANVTFSEHFSNLDTWSHKNYCRNPYGKERPWCFIMDEGTEWEYCDIPMCTNEDPPECKVTQQGGEYIGRMNVSHSGFACKAWMEPWRRTITGNETFFLPAFPDYGETGESHNFCRNPDGDAAPWCVIKGEDLDKEYCDIPFCKVREVQGGSKGNVYPECRLTEKGKEYVGTKSVTETGKPCVDWEKNQYGMPWDFFNQEMGYSDHFIYADPTIHKNYCRNHALYREKPWCFVSEPDIEWEYCDIPLCHYLEPPECKLTPRGGEYVGRRNTTISGFRCQHWLSVYPHSHEKIKEYLSAFPDEIDGRHNFCRNPDNTAHGPWCYLKEFEHRWEYCDVPFCPRTEGERCDIRVSGECMSPLQCKKNTGGLAYIGTKNVTNSGNPCQLWMSILPNDISERDSFLARELFPDDLHPSHNFCRNPGNNPEGPWCFNGASRDLDWEFCDIEFC